MIAAFDHCPSCREELVGAPIPQEYRDKGYYGKATHYRREISIVVNDHHVCWECPDCGHQWGRAVPQSTEER